MEIWLAADALFRCVHERARDMPGGRRGRVQFRLPDLRRTHGRQQLEAASSSSGRRARVPYGRRPRVPFPILIKTWLAVKTPLALGRLVHIYGLLMKYLLVDLAALILRVHVDLLAFTVDFVRLYCICMYCVRIRTVCSM